MTVGNLLPSQGAESEPTPETPAEHRLAVTRLAMVLVAFGVLAVWRWSVALFVLVLVGSIVLHEMGHYLGARRGGMKATQFFVGFGPRIFSVRRGETEFGLKPILLGAYVKVPGLTNLEEVDEADEARTYRAASYGRRARMVFAGPGMNLLIALLGFIAFFTLYDEPVLNDTGTPTIEVAADTTSPASVAGLESGDRVLALDGEEFTTIQAVVDYLRAHPGDAVTVTVARGEVRLDVPVTLADSNPSTGEAVGYLGARFGGDITYIDRNVAEGVQAGFTEFGREVGLTVKGIGEIFSPSGLVDLGRKVLGNQPDDTTARPTSMIGIVGMGAEAVESGFATLLGLTASLNLALGLFNLLPLLPFDGGHLVIATYERLRSRRGTRYSVDFGRVMAYSAPLFAVLAFVMLSALFLDARSHI